MTARRRLDHEQRAQRAAVLVAVRAAETGHPKTNVRGIQRRAAIVAAIRDLTAERGYPPTVREVGARSGLVSSSSVQHQLKQLKDEGVVRWEPDTPRSLVLVGEVCQSCHGTGRVPGGEQT